MDFAAGAAGGDGGRILPGSWPEPCGTVRGRFGDGSRTIRGRFGDDSRTIRGRPSGEARSDHGGDPGDGAQPGGGRARPVGTLAGSCREAGRILQGSWPEPSGTVRGRPGGEARSDQAGAAGDGAEPGAGRARPVGTLAGSFREAGRILRGSWPEPSGKLAGTFGDGSGTIRGRFGDDSGTIRGLFGGGSAVRPRRRAGRGRLTGRGGRVGAPRRLKTAAP